MMFELDDLIPGTPMSYRERLELAIADKRGIFDFPPELKEVRGAAEYAAVRAAVWLEWNERYSEAHSKTNTQERYLKAQAFSRPYALAVYKALVGLAVAKVSSFGAGSLLKAREALRELLWTYGECSVCVMAATAKAARQIINGVKKKNLTLGLALEAEFRNKDEGSVKSWVGDFCRKAG